MDGSRLVKVDNWALFFLQKLQALYRRGDYCDLTLQFHTNECIRVHRLVLNTCTEYFENLIKQTNATNHMRLPPSLQSDVLVPIINFMYSGRLEFRPELHSRLYNTARILNMQILTKLLDTSSGPLAKSSPTPNSTPVKRLQSVTPSPSSSVNRNKYFEPDHNDIVPGKRLPIWKKRASSSSFSVNVTPRTVVEEPAKPTRFEWPEDEDSGSAPLLYSSTFDDISYDSVPIVKSITNLVQSSAPQSTQALVQLPQERVMPAATFESVCQSAQLKRDPSSSGLSECPSKKAKLDIDDVKELLQEQEVRKNLIGRADDEIEQDTEDLEDFLPEADMDDEEEEGDEIGNGDSQMNKPSAPQKGTPKPILKIHDSPDAANSPSKKVRFSLEPKVKAVTPVLNTTASNVSNCSSGNGQTTVETGTANYVQNSVSEKTIVTNNSGGSSFEIRATTTAVTKSADGTTTQTTVPNVTDHHAKIIAEVLKKYPDLVKNNKNIRLKIMQKDGSSSVSVEKSGGTGDKPKVSYMVVKADPNLKGKLGETSKPSGAHNTTGPWVCQTCGEPDQPILFDTYYSYRKHLQEVHQEKIDVRICEHCGHRASKRNLLLYHLYTKHGVPPPRSLQFPKCDVCEYVALSETLLVKHKNIHGTSKDFSCRLCNSSFKNYGALQTHMQTNLHCAQQKKTYDCPVCQRTFQRRFNLKTHICTEHKDVSIKLDDTYTDSPSQQSPVETVVPDDQESEGQVLVETQQAQLHAQASVQPQTTYILPPGVTLLADGAQGALMPSTEAEAFSNVASGIAASLGVNDSMVVGEQGQSQTLILVDKGQTIQLLGGGTGAQVHEYIVPEIMASDIGQSVGVYTSGQLSQLVQYAGGLQQPVAVSTDQGLMTITTVSANGSIINQGTQVMTQPIVSLAQGDHGTGEIAMILTDHAYSEGMVRENGTVLQTGVPVTMAMVSESGIPVMTTVVNDGVSVAPAVQCDSDNVTCAVDLTDEEAPDQVECENDESNSVPQELTEPEEDMNSEMKEEVEEPAQQPQKMVDLVSDWDDVEDDDRAGVDKSNQQETEDAAMPSRPTILLKSELEHDDLSDNLVKIT